MRWIVLPARSNTARPPFLSVPTTMLFELSVGCTQIAGSSASASSLPKNGSVSSVACTSGVSATPAATTTKPVTASASSTSNFLICSPSLLRVPESSTVTGRGACWVAPWLTSCGGPASRLALELYTQYSTWYANASEPP